ncbi:MAG: hypothetical protein KatS3mg033_0650 [Thermonema sp.]|uniref:putative porin n=1 Tax=Thermonema sp. TaxID=2231181 RepID=UPI0021DE169F|nr:putative porin [Thermonema sp.]GIV38850.1 MAG: hypothetical protein KatS3mg033_0650 [Thermonema sp.]
MQKSILFFVFSFLFIAPPGFVQAQILDDSTKQVYGTSTTRFITEKDWLGDSTAWRSLDTTVRGFHRYHPVRRSHYLLQDLGHNLGTATQSLFPQLPGAIGRHYGWDVYAPYVVQAEEVKYFDTKSPFTHFYYALGGRGQQIAELEFSRNITPLWNFGFLYRRINTFRQFAATGNRNEDAILEQYNFVLHMSRRSKNGRYRFLTHYAHFNAPMQEYGGILMDEDDTPDSLYQYAEEGAQLLGASSWQTQNRYYLYHDYRLDSLFQLYHRGYYLRRRDRYHDDKVSDNPQTDFYGTLPSGKISDDVIYRELYNELGIKGAAKSFRYRLFYRNRLYDLRFGWDNDSTQGALTLKPRMEHHLGAALRLRKEKLDLYAEGAYRLGSDYLLQAWVRLPWFEASAKSSYVSPTWQQQYYWGSTGYWHNDFSPVFGNELEAGLPLRRKQQRLFSFVRLRQASSWVYFQKDSEGRVQPFQSGELQAMGQVGIKAHWQWRYFHWQHELYLSKDLGERSVWRFPEVFWFTSLFYERDLFKGNMQLCVGMDGRYQSAYEAYAYSPLHKVFYLADVYAIRPYFLADVYANIKVKQLRAALQFTHVNQNMAPPPFNGYQVTPYYAGMRRTLSLVLSWMFFE